MIKDSERNKMTSISKKAKKEIEGLINAVVLKYIKASNDDPKKNSGNPFVGALLSDFEPLVHRIHGLKTSIGSEMEKIAEIIAVDAWGRENIVRKINREVELPKNVFQTIDSIINGLSNAQKLSNYINELKLIKKACKNPSKTKEKHTYEFDLEIHDPKTQHHYFFEMKGPDPNTTEVPGAKKRLLVEYAWGLLNVKAKNIDAIFGIYYNNKHPKPYKNPKVHYYFDPDGGLLVHDGFWNFVGNNGSTYQELVAIFENYGKKNKAAIWKSFSELIKKK
jgi:hypothetical protein